MFSKTESVAMPVTASTGGGQCRWRLPKMLIVCMCVKKMEAVDTHRLRLNLNFRMSRM